MDDTKHGRHSYKGNETEFGMIAYERFREQTRVRLPEWNDLAEQVQQVWIEVARTVIACLLDDEIDEGQQ